MFHPLAVLAWLVAPPPDPAALAVELGSRSYAARDRAERQLWQLGRAARPAVAAAAVSPDPEVRQRAAAVLERFDWGIYPDTPPDVRKLIDQFRSGDPDRQNKAIDELLLLNDRGLDALVAILARDFLPDRQRSLFKHLSRQVRQALPGDLLAGRFDRAERLLEAAALGGDPDAWADYAVLMRLRNRLPAAAEVMRRYGDRPGPRGESATAARAWAEVLAGRPAAAARTLDKLADRSAAPDPDWPAAAASAREEAGDWAGLAAGGPAQPLTLFRLQLAGDRAAADRMAKELSTTIPAGFEEDTATSLFLCRRPADGLAVLARYPRVRADLRTDLLAARGEFDAALRLTVPKADDVPDPDAAVPPGFLIRRGRLLAQLGRTDEADRQFETVAAGLRRAALEDWNTVIALLRAEVRANRTDLAAAHAARFLDQMDRLGQGHDHSPSPFELLFDDDAEAARGWWTALRQHGPKEQPAESMTRVRELLAGTASADRRAAADAAIKRWHDAVHRADYPNPDLRMRLALARAAAARAVGDLSTAEQQLSQAAAAAGQAKDDADDPDGGPRGWVYGTDERFRAALDHGDLLMDLGRPADAAAAYLDGWRRFPDNPILLYLSGRALLAAGQADEGERRIERAHWVPLGSGRMRGRFLEELCSRGRKADLRRARDLTRACVWCWAEQHGNVWNQLMRASALLDEFDAAAAAGDRLLHYILRTNQIVKDNPNGDVKPISFVDGSAYATMPMHAVLFRARAKLAAGDADAAVRLANEYLDALPMAVEPLLGLIPELDARGRPADADALFRRVWGVYEALTTEYPASAWARTSAALFAAGGRRELDAGLAHARLAVELDPTSRAAKEALAEVRFRRGERPEAVRLMRELCKAEPRSRFYRRQLERYRSGDAASRLPLGPEG